MAKKRAAKATPRRRLKRLPKLKGAELVEITVRSAKKRATEGKRPIPKKELEIAEE
jgi:hypothetical protein